MPPIPWRPFRSSLLLWACSGRLSWCRRQLGHNAEGWEQALATGLFDAHTPMVSLAELGAPTSERPAVSGGAEWAGDFEALKAAFPNYRYSGKYMRFKLLKPLGLYRENDQALGQGAFGAVFQAVDTKASSRRKRTKKLAIKQVPISRSSRRNLALMEIQINSLLRQSNQGHGSPFTLPFITSRCDGDTYAYLVMPKCRGFKDSINLEELSSYFSLQGKAMRLTLAQLALAVRGAHRAGVVHFDLKPDNVLLDRELKPGVPFVQLADFGLGSIFTLPDDKVKRSRKGSPMYMAPELFDTELEHVSSTVDWWSFGVLALVLAHGDVDESFVPLRDRRTKDFQPSGLARSPRKVVLDVFEEASDDVTLLVDLCLRYLLKKEPRDRFSSLNAKDDDHTFEHPFWKHDFWAGLKFADLELESFKM